MPNLMSRWLCSNLKSIINNEFFGIFLITIFKNEAITGFNTLYPNRIQFILAKFYCNKIKWNEIAQRKIAKYMWYLKNIIWQVKKYCFCYCLMIAVRFDNSYLTGLIWHIPSESIKVNYCGSSICLQESLSSHCWLISSAIIPHSSSFIEERIFKISKTCECPFKNY